MRVAANRALDARVAKGAEHLERGIHLVRVLAQARSVHLDHAARARNRLRHLVIVLPRIETRMPAVLLRQIGVRKAHDGTGMRRHIEPGLEVRTP